MRAQKGFTLVEIAIVLVIVGLLLGGVLKGQSLIGSAKINNVIKKMQSLQTSFYAFGDKYGGVPGDLRNASGVISGEATDCSTNCDNGRIDGWQNASMALNHLSAAGLYSGPFASTETNARPTVTDAPDNSFGGAMFMRRWNQIAFTGTRQNHTAVWTGDNMPAEVLAEIDRKIDDGFPQTGSFRASWPDFNGRRCFDATANTWELDGENCGGALLF